MAAASPQLVDHIYEAAMIPELWNRACEMVSGEIGAFSASVITISPEGVLRWVSSDCIFEDMVRYQNDGFAARNERPARGLSIAPGSFLRDIDILTPAELEVDPMSTDLLRPIGLAWEMGSVLQEPSGSFLIHSLLGKTENGPFSVEAVERMNALKADLNRAAFMATRLAFQQARTITATLSTIGLPGAVIGDNCGVIAMNADMEALSPRIQTGFGDRIAIANIETDRLFQDILAQIRLGISPLVQSFPISADEDKPALVLHVIPVKRDARDIFSRSQALVIATPVGEVGPPDQRVICGLFDLTRVEARVAQEVASGCSIDEAAAILGIGRETVRTHLKAIFKKTGVRRQKQLVLLLSALGRPLKM